MFVAGDIGGTKSNLAFFELRDADLTPLYQKSLRSKDYETLADLLKEFLGGTELKARHAYLSIAGPVKGGRCKTPNLPWDIDQDVLERTISFDQVELMNDLVANAHGISVLAPEDFVVLNPGDAKASGNAAVISAGTGLGEAGLFWDGQRHQPFPSEGGHANFGPTDDVQIELLQFMQRQAFAASPNKSIHVSYERVLSGPGLYNIYKFLREKGEFEEPAWLAEELTDNADHGAIVSRAALDKNVELCVQCLNLFAIIYGSEAGNLALKVMAIGGMYIGGGIAPKILRKLQEPYFMEAFIGKGRMRSLLEGIPVKVIMNDRTALLGAAKVGREVFAKISAVR